MYGNMNRELYKWQFNKRARLCNISSSLTERSYYFLRFFVKFIVAILLCLYLFILSQQILFKFLPLHVIVNHFRLSFEGEIFWGSHNFIPFKTIFYYLFSATDMSFSVRVANLAGNVIGFIPFGFLVPILSKRFLNLKIITLATFCLSLAFELTQLIFRFGSFDVDDLILNTLGGVLGYFVISLIFNYVYRNRI